jgi:hypothetical protein
MIEHFHEEDEHEKIKLKQNKDKKDQFHVNPIGMKIVLFTDKLETANNTNPFYSMFGPEDGEERYRGKIIGT